MTIIGKLDRVEYLLKHLPGRHDQQRHAPHTVGVATSEPGSDGLFKDIDGDVLEEGTYIPRHQKWHVKSIQFKLLRKNINGEIGRNTYEITHDHVDGNPITYKVRHMYVPDPYSTLGRYRSRWDYFRSSRARNSSQSDNLHGIAENMYSSKR